MDALNRKFQRKDDKLRGLETEQMDLLAAQHAARRRSSKAESQMGRRCEVETKRANLDPLVRTSKKRQMDTENSVTFPGAGQAVMEARNNGFKPCLWFSEPCGCAKS